MKITKKINNNVALAIDSAGKDVVVFGKGIGFPAMPYELEDHSKIQRTFYDIKASYVELATSLPEDMILLAADIAEMAQAGLDCKLNPNMPFTLADHLSFAIERFTSGMQLSTPLSYDVAHFFPVEVSLGQRVLEMVKERKGISLPESEAVSIALHLVNNEMENSDMHATLKAAEVIRDVTGIIEQVLHIRLDTASFNYSRFVMHIRYLLQRMEQDDQEQNGMSIVMRQLRWQYPDIYRCTLAIQDYLHNSYHRHCSQDEMLYLFMHINRLNERSKR
ncbi:MAG: PRD domain-containing protein [Clostridia bacterium]|nr:PRD domain-containing protein [Clostridia bacterium]